MDIILGTAADLPAGLFNALARYRHRVFVETLHWPLITRSGLELDQFDRADTVYIVARHSSGEVIGTARLLSTERPYLLDEIFPVLLGGTPAPHTPLVWELSRFATGFHHKAAAQTGAVRQFDRAIAPLLLRRALAFLASVGARQLVSVSPLGVERILRREGFSARRLAAPVQFDGQWLCACRIDVLQLPVTLASPQPALH